MKQYASQIRRLDALVQKWACQQRSYVSGLPAQCGHHYIGRSDMLLRWDLKNIIPLTQDEHRRVHDGFMAVNIKNPFREQYLRNRKNKGLKAYLLENGLTVGEFVKDCENKIKSALI